VARPAVLVSGGAGGLGAAAAEALAARGCAVAVADLDLEGAERVAEACRARVPAAFAIGVDLATAEGPARMVEAAAEGLGGLDVLVQCAAVAPAEAFLAMTAEAWEAALLVNVRACALATAAAGRIMKAQGRGGRIVHVTSAASRMALPDYTAYAASKAAVDSLTRSAAVALAPWGITVTSLSPGMMDTPLQRRTEESFARLSDRSDLEAFRAERTARIPLGRRTDPTEMAAVIVWLALDAPAYMTAARLNVTGGLDKD
jgi:NAD(P)-dependent dehydrogenase (short-subunit alcohol dehydrogenase family)